MKEKKMFLTTLAKVLWEQNRDELLNLSRADPKIQNIIDYLNADKSSINPDPHPLPFSYPHFERTLG